MANNRIRIAKLGPAAIPIALALFVSPIHAAAPEWLKTAARVQLPAYSEETDAALLYDSQTTTVRQDGEIETVYRRAYRILRPQGRQHGVVTVNFDNETRLTYLKGWCLPADGKEYEVKEKDAVETAMLTDSLYSDTRHKILSIPAADPGNVIGYEFQQRRRPSVYQDLWGFQDTHPVIQSRFELRLPEGWEFAATWVNHPPAEPSSAGPNAWSWEVRDMPAVDSEPSMPHWRAVAGWMGIAFFPKGDSTGTRAAGNWRQVGQWFSALASARDKPTPEIAAKSAELTAGIDNPLEKIAALAGFVQKDIRYVAIEIGIGGYQPHTATEVFSNRYGDCKDKATLLKAMLSAIGVQSHYVLIHTERGVVAPSFPTALSFNHAILAIRVPEDTPEGRARAILKDEQLGTLLFFDPTDTLTRFGDLAGNLQANHGLLVASNEGTLVRLPLLPPVSNRLLRVADLTLDATGALAGSVQEVRWGSMASSRRAAFLAAESQDLARVVEDYLAGNLPGFRLKHGSVENLRDYDKNLVLKYEFSADRYAKSAGGLLLLRPRVLGQKGYPLGRDKRQNPLEFDSPSLETDRFDIRLPAGYEIDELPAPVKVEYPFGSYESSIQLDQGVLRYTRSYEMREVSISLEKIPDFREFMRRIAEDEKAAAVLKKVAQ